VEYPYEKRELDGIPLERAMTPRELSGEKDPCEMAIEEHEIPVELSEQGDGAVELPG